MKLRSLGRRCAAGLLSFALVFANIAADGEFAAYAASTSAENSASDSQGTSQEEPEGSDVIISDENEASGTLEDVVAEVGETSVGVGQQDPADEEEDSELSEGDDPADEEEDDSELAEGEDSENDGQEDNSVESEGDDAILSALQGTELTQDTSVDVRIRAEGEVQWFYFTPDKSGVYRFASSGDYDTYAAIYSVGEDGEVGELLAENDDSNSGSESELANFALDYALEAGVTYYYMASMRYEDVTGSFEVEVSWLYKAIASIEDQSIIRDTYYYGYDTSIDYSGFCWNVTYTDGTSETLRGSSAYSSLIGKSVTFSNSYSTEYVNGRSVLKKGTVSTTVTFLDQKKVYTAQVVDENPPELTTETSLSWSGQSYAYAIFTAPETDYYLFSESYENYRLSIYIYDSNWQQIESTSYSYNNTYAHVVYLEKGSTYIVYLNNGYSNNSITTATLSVQRAELLEGAAEGQGASLLKFTPTEDNYYEIRRTESGYNYDDELSLLDENGEAVSYNHYSSYDSEGNYVRTYETDKLSPEHTYYLFVGSSKAWSLQIKSTDDLQSIAAGAEIQETLQGEADSYAFTAEQAGTYHFQVKSSVWLDSMIRSFGSGVIHSYSGSHWEEVEDDEEIYYRDYVYQVAEGQKLKIVVGESGGNAAYTLTAESLPDVESVSVTKLPDKTTYLRTDSSISYSGMEITVTYADGSDETIAYGNYSSRTGIRFYTSYSDLYKNSRLAVGTHTITVSYLWLSAAFEVQVEKEEDSDEITELVLDETVDVQASLPENTESDYVWISYNFTPEETGSYQVTAGYNQYYFWADVYDSDRNALSSIGDSSTSSDDTYSYRHRNYYLEAGETYLIEAEVYLNAAGTYKYNMLVSKSDIPTLAVGDVVSGTVENYTSFYQYYIFTPEVERTYSFVMRMTDYSGRGISISTLDGESISATNSSDSYSDGWYYYTAQANLKAGQSYLIRNYLRGYNISYEIGPEAVEVTPLTLDQYYDVSIDMSGQRQWFSFTPEESGRYRFFSVEYADGNSYDTYGELYEGAPYSSMIAYNDDGGESLNFQLDYELQADVTYYYAARMLGSNTGNYMVCLEKIPSAESIDIVRYPQTTYCLPLDNYLSAYGLQINVSYEDGTIETLSYESRSSVTGEYIRVQREESGTDFDDLGSGEYTVVVTYAGASTQYTITIEHLEEEAQTLSLEDPVTGNWEEGTSSYWSFTPESTGLYAFRTEQNGTYLYPYLYLDGSSVSVKFDKSSSYTNAEGTTIYYYEKAYYLEAGNTYYLKASLSSGTEESDSMTYTISVSSATEIGVGDACEETLESGQCSYFKFQVTEAAYYKLETESDGTQSSSSNYMIMSLCSASSSSVSSYSSSYGNLARIYTYLEPGTYWVRTSPNSYAGQYRLTVAPVDAMLFPGTEDGSFEGTYEYTAHAYVVTPSASGTYKFRYYTKYYSNNELALYDSTNSKVTSYSTRTYDNDTNMYVYTMAAELTEGQSYMVIVKGHGGYDYTIEADSQMTVEAIEVLKYPQEVYYYKLDKLSSSTSSLGSGASIRITYSDGTVETLSGSYTSSVTGMKFSVQLPEDALYNSQGYVMPGTYKAILTYMEQTAEIPITVKQISSMPRIVLDENGQGSYTGTVENETGQGYIRFVAAEDAFYNMTLSVDKGNTIYFSNVYNSAYKNISTYNTGYSSTDTKYLRNASVYVRKGQTCYIKYSASSGAKTYTLSVEKATDQVITELSLNEDQDVTVTSYSDYQWFSFTPETTGRYILSSENAPSYVYMALYNSPDASSSLTSSVSTTNGYNRSMTYTLTAGKTYYYRVNCNTAGTFSLILVKAAKAVSIELLTEGEIYCSSLPGYINNSFANLEFLVTYDDDTTEVITFGYNGTTSRYTSHQREQMSYVTPNWEYDENNEYILDKEYTVRFYYMTKSVSVTVIARSIQDLVSADDSFTATIAAGKYEYYQFKPDTSGYYRFTASAEGTYPQLDLYDKYMHVMDSDYSNSWVSDSAYNRVKVYALEAGETYCLRLGNLSSSSMSITETSEIISPVESLTISTYPQINYYLGIDSRYSEDGLSVLVTYEDETTETLAAGERSATTGLTLSSMISGSTSGNHYLGTQTGSRTVNVTYMGKTASYTIHVTDNASVPEVTEEKACTGTLDSGKDYVYVKYVPETTGFYRLRLMADDEDTSTAITNVKNSSYSDLNTYSTSKISADGKNGSEAIVYLLAGRTYYLKGNLTKDGEHISGDYSVSVSQVEDLVNGVQTGTIKSGVSDVYQFTPSETAYYQFTLDAAENVSLKLYSSSLNSVSMTEGKKDGKDRTYYAVKLKADTVYLVTCKNASGTSQDYSVYASKKPAITGISVSSMPEKTVYYTAFESTINTEGLAIDIAYEDGTTETLVYGSRSSWGVGMNLDYSSVVRDEKKNFVAGTQTIGCTYLDQETSFTFEAVEFDLENVSELAAETTKQLALEVGESAFYKITPTETATYRFYSRGDYATVGYIYDSSLTLVKSNAGSNFSITAELAAGETYILRVRAQNSRLAISTGIRLHDTSKYTEVTGVNISESSVVLNEVNAAKALTVEVEPSDAKDKTVTWESSDPDVVSVDENGTVTAIAVGSAVITVTSTDGGYTDTCKVTVDTEAPVITQVYPVSGSYVGPSARRLWIYAHDNTGVETVTVEYKKASDSEWTKFIVSDKDEDDNTDSVILADLPLDDFDDGDEIEVHFTAKDKGGTYSDPVVYTYTVDKNAPEIEDLYGTYNKETLAVDLSWTGKEETDISTYAVYRKITGMEDGTYQYLGAVTGYVNKADYTYTDSTVGNEDASYTYKVTANDKRGNSRTYTVEVSTTRVNQAPEIKLNCASTMVSGKEYSFDLTNSKDDRLISSFTVDFGDGSEAETGSTEDVLYQHTYVLKEDETEQTYTVTVTAEDNEGKRAVLTKEIRVVNLDDVGMLTVLVVDEDGIPLANAPVYFNMGDDDQIITNTDRTGKAEFTDIEGFHTVGTYVNGYLPVKKVVELSVGEQTTLTFALEEKDLVEATFETHRMTLDEIKDAGIDLDATTSPENYHVVQYNVTLEYSTLNFYTGGDAVYSVSGGREGYHYVVQTQDEIVVILEIPVAVSILKEFYQVNMYILNNASEEFSLLENHITLNVPDGLTVMEEGSPAEVTVDEIKGGSTETIRWILRGDKSGEYQLSADYAGVLSEFNVPVTSHFTSDETIRVYGVDNLSVKMQIPDSFTNGEFYYNLIMMNTAEIGDDAADMYLPGLNGEGELIQTMLQKEDNTTEYLSAMPEVLHAGENIERFYRITDQISEQLAKYPNYEDFVFYFKKALVEELSSYGVTLEIEVLPADELAAVYDKYRAMPATDVTVEATGADYGYEAGDVVLTASAEAAENAEYTLTYEWYDTLYNKVGEGESYAVSTGLSAGEYHYHCVVVSTRKDNGNKAQTEYQDVVVTINQKEVALEWSGYENLVYNGEPVSVTAALTGLIAGDECEVTVTGGSETNAGTYTAEAVSLSNDNYKLPENTKLEYTITPKTVSLTWDGTDTRVYDKTPSNVTATAGDLIGEDICDVTVTGGTETDAGTHTATAAELSNTNYKLPEDVTTEYTITPKTVELIWSGTERIYDGAESNVQAEADGLEDGDTCSVTVTGGTEKNAGTYTATAEGLSNSNYKLPESVTTEYTITPKTVELSWSGNEERTYDGIASNVQAAAVGLAEGDICEVTVTGATETNVGTYTATATELSNSNYKLSENVATEYTISPATVTLTWSGTEERTYDGTSSNVQATAGGLAEGDTCDVTVTGGTETNAGTHTATAAELSNSNYKLPEVSTTSYTITPATVTLSWSGTEERTYDGTASNVQAAAGGMIGDDTCTVTVTGGTEKNAGTHTATAAGLSNSNYKLPEAHTAEYTITPATVTLSWSGTEERTYDGTASNVQATAGGLVEGDTCSVTVTGGTEKNAGTYTATAAELSNTNYKLPEDVTAEYTITPKTVELIWSGTERIYDGTASDVQAAAGGLAEGDTCDVTVTGGTETNAGTYTATAEGLSNSNYKLPESVATEYTITPKTVELSWSGNEERTYDGIASNVQAAAVGLAEGDTCDVTVTGGTETNAGTYTATATELSNSNYKLSENVATEYTITPATVTLSWSGTEERTYDGTASCVQATAGGLAEGDACDVTVTGGTETNAGTYTATAAKLSNSNYKLPEVSTTSYTITPVTVTLTWSGTEERTYDGTDSNVQATAGGMIGDDTCTVTVTGGTEKNAGTHTATAAGLSNSNYKLPEAHTTSYTITPKAVTLTWSGTEERTYDGNASNVQATAVGLAAGDTCSVIVTGATEKNAGTHTATATGLSNSNYKLPSDESVNVSYVVKQLTAEIRWEKLTRVYDGTDSGVTAVVANKATGDTCEVILNGQNGKTPGTYTATATGLSNSNYLLPENTSAQYVITKADSTIQVSETIQKHYGDDAFSLGAVLSREGALSYESTNTAVATVDQNGTVTVTGVGTAQIKIAAAENDCYNAASALVTVTVEKMLVKVLQSVTSNTTAAGMDLITVTYGDAPFALGASTNSDGALSYASSNTDVVTVDNAGTVTVVGAGTAEITITSAETETCAEMTNTVSIIVNKAATGLTVSKTSYKKVKGAKAFTLKASTSAGTAITYASSNKRVAAVGAKTGKVTIKGCGKAIITVTSGDANHTTETKTVTIQVVPKKATIKSVVSKKSGQLTIKWKKQTEASGYVVEVATNKKFTKNKKTVIIKKSKTTSTTIKGLKKGKKYYVRVKAYTTIDKKRVCGKASKITNQTVSE